MGKWCLDIKFLFLGSPMATPRYMKIKASLLPSDIIIFYNLTNKIAPDGYVYVKIVKGMYGLKEAAVLAYNQLSKFMKKYGYYHVPGTSGLWRHISKPTAFCLCVDDIALKYYSNADLQHFLTALGNHYEYHYDSKGKNYMGFHI